MLIRSLEHCSQQFEQILLPGPEVGNQQPDPQVYIPHIGFSRNRFVCNHHQQKELKALLRRVCRPSVSGRLFPHVLCSYLLMLLSIRVLNIQQERAKVILTAPARPMQMWFHYLICLPAYPALQLPTNPYLSTHDSGYILHLSLDKLQLKPWFVYGSLRQRSLFVRCTTAFVEKQKSIKNVPTEMEEIPLLVYPMAFVSSILLLWMF